MALVLLLSLAVGSERPIGQWAALGRGSTAQHTQVRLPAVTTVYSTIWYLPVYVPVYAMHAVSMCRSLPALPASHYK